MKTHYKLLLSAVAIFSLIVLAGCGDGRSPQPAGTSPGTPSVSLITVSVSPSSISLGAYETQQFTATVTNTDNTAVTWSMKCSTNACGTMSPSGLYTAPDLIVNPVSVEVSATSQADTTKKSSAWVNQLPLAVQVSPLLAMTMAPGAAQTLTASIFKHPNQNVSWSISGMGCSGSACGTLTNVTTSSATYTAPATFATGATAIVSATSVADSTRSDRVKINLMPISEPLKGRYAFMFRSGNSDTVFAASLMGNGAGQLSGVGDLITASGVQSNQAFSGTYTLGADHRGTMQISGAGTTLHLRFVMLTGNSGRLLDFCGTSDGNGRFERQNESSFNITGLTGAYVYLLAGVTGTTFMSRIADLGFAPPCDASGGELVNDATMKLFSGGYGWNDFSSGCSIDPTAGRVSLVPWDWWLLTPPSTVFYIVDATRAFMLGNTADKSVRLAGTMDAFAGYALSGDYTYYVVTAAGFAAGRFTAALGADGKTVVITGVQDEVTESQALNDVVVSGQMSEQPPGLSLSIGGVALVEPSIHPISPGRLVLSGNGFYGEAFLQEGGPFSSTTVTGNFGLQLYGRDAHVVGMATLAPPTMTGKTDVSNNGLTSDAETSGTIAFVSADRANVSLSSAATGAMPFRAYVISPNKLLLISTRPGQVTMGWAEKME